MKNKNLLTLLISIVMISVAFLAGCKKDGDDDDNKNVNSKCRITKQTITFDGGPDKAYFYYSYDSLKRLISYTINSSLGSNSAAISYNGSTVEYSDNIFENLFGETVIITVNNSKGLPQQITHHYNAIYFYQDSFSNTYNATYSTDGKLLNVQGNYGGTIVSAADSGNITISDIVYSNGNIITAKITYTSHGGVTTINNLTFDYYTDQENSLKHLYTGTNPFDRNLFYFRRTGGLAIFSKNLLKYSLISEGTANTSTNYSYTYDNDGKIISMSMYGTMTGGSTSSEDSEFEYVCD
jgi:hypothetical protein